MMGGEGGRDLGGRTSTPAAKGKGEELRRERRILVGVARVMKGEKNSLRIGKRVPSQQGKKETADTPLKPHVVREEGLHIIWGKEGGEWGLHT